MFIFYFFSFRNRISELRWPIAVKLCHVISIWLNFIMQVQKIWGPPLKNLGPKHAKFGSILHNFRLWSRISRKWDKISKIGKTSDRERFLPRLVKHVRWTLVHFIITRARHWPRLASTHHKPGRGPPAKKKGRSFKIGLKIPHMRAYNFGGSGRNLTKYYQGMWLKAGVITWTVIFTRGAPYKIWVGKNVQNSAQFLTTFDFDCEYLRNGTTNRKLEKYLINYISSPIGQKNFGPQTRQL